MKNPKAILRQALRSDAPDLWRVRYAVRENTLTPGRISDDELFAQIEVTGRGWIVEVEGEAGPNIVGFAIGDAKTASIWALFVDPAHEGLGYGSALHGEMLTWMWAQGLRTLWLHTAPGTRAESFYRRAGWHGRALTEHGELHLEMTNPHLAI